MRCVLVVLMAACLGVAAADHFKESPYKRRSLHELIKRGWCRNEGDTCAFVPPCCGDLQCVKLSGDTLGTCSTCRDLNEICQLDRHCCSSYQCDKESDTAINGWCRSPRSNGSQCWENSQCASGHCNDSDFYPDSGICE